jgi:class 3 adenylate cyclase
VIRIDECATPVQHDALLKLVTGQLGGAFAELATLIGEVGAIERSSIRIDLGVHTGVAYVGAVGSDSTVADFSALGDAVIVAARLASIAGAGEALISEAAHTASGSDLGDLERRELSVRGKDAPLAVRVLRA